MSEVLYYNAIPQIIIFDGMDKTGKSTLKAALDKSCNFFHWTIDRGPLSHMVYNYVYDRHKQNERIHNITNICTNAVLVYCYASISVIKTRIENSPGEPTIDVERDISAFKHMLSATVHLYKKVIIINTSEPISTCLNKLKKNLSFLT